VATLRNDRHARDRYERTCTVSDATVISMNEAPARLTALVKAARMDEPLFIATDEGVRAVLLGIDAYDTLIERLEDLEDSLSILEARIANESTRPLDELLQEQREMRIADVPG